MARLGSKTQQLRGVATPVVAAALLLYAAGIHVAKPAPTADITGNYKVKVSGYGKGAGTCTVGDKVAVDCVITDDDGVDASLKATNLKLEGSRFRGDGSLDGVKVRIAGRVDPPNATVSVPRLAATFVADDGRTGRILGKHD